MGFVATPGDVTALEELFGCEKNRTRVLVIQYETNTSLIIIIGKHLTQDHLESSGPSSGAVASQLTDETQGNANGAIMAKHVM
jgi:hypothetical protein